MGCDMSDLFDIDEIKKRQNAPGQWVYIIPIDGVKLTGAVKNEFQIDRILLVDKVKLPRIRKRLGLPQKISEFKDMWSGFFSRSDTYAVVRHSGNPTETRKFCRQLVRDELALLALSQLGYSRRRYGNSPSILGIQQSSQIKDLLLNSADGRKSLQGKLEGKYRPLVMDKRWYNYQKEQFFFNLLKILRKEIKVSNTWRQELSRAALLVGQSLCSTDLAYSFLWNMIALEMLLTRQGDKYTDVLPKLYFRLNER